VFRPSRLCSFCSRTLSIRSFFSLLCLGSRPLDFDSQQHKKDFDTGLEVGTKDSQINSLMDLIRELGATPNRCTLRCTNFAWFGEKHLASTLATWLFLQQSIWYLRLSTHQLQPIQGGIKITGWMFTCQALRGCWWRLVPRVRNPWTQMTNRRAHYDLAHPVEDFGSLRCAAWGGAILHIL
jgi:hypothetical protein